MMDPFLPKEKFLPVAVCAVFRVELARAVFREKEMSLCLCQCGVLHRPGATPGLKPLSDSDDSASPLQQGERIACRAVAEQRREVRAYSPRALDVQRKPSPCPPPCQARGDCATRHGFRFEQSRPQLA